jgi:hypothetical protein
MRVAWLNNRQFHSQFYRKKLKIDGEKNFDLSQTDEAFRNSSGSLAMFAAIRRLIGAQLRA